MLTVILIYTTYLRADVVAYHVQTCQSPYTDVFYGHCVVHITINSCTTGNTIPHCIAKYLENPIIEIVSAGNSFL